MVNNVYFIKKKQLAKLKKKLIDIFVMSCGYETKTIKYYGTEGMHVSRTNLLL